MRSNFLCLTALLLLAGCQHAPTGLWQNATVEAPGESPPKPTSQWLELDTGGSGGGFGNGDIRQKLHDIAFWNDRLGWTCGYGGVFRTADGGLTWQRIKPKGGWYHLQMTGPHEVWLLEGFHGQAKARLWHTEDDGDSWVEVAPDTFKGYSDLHCLGDEVWVLCSGYPSYRSRDRGNTWQRLALPAGPQRPIQVAIPGDIRGPDGYTIYLLGSQGDSTALAKSIDSGEHWSTLPLPALPAHHRARIFFATSQRGWVSGAAGMLLTTSDGGDTWKHVDLPTDQTVSAIWFDQLGRGFVAVDNTDFEHPRNTLYETPDGGQTWAPVFGGRKQVSAIFSLGPGKVWVAGDTPGRIPNDFIAILRSVNWQRPTTP